MNAREIAEKIGFEVITDKEHCKAMTNEDHLIYWERLIQQYAKEKCKEQRELCARVADQDHLGIPALRRSIRNAPTPFD